MIYVIVKKGQEPEVRKQFTFVSRLKKIVKYLMHEDYRVVDSEMNVYDSIHLEFANGCHIYDNYSDLKNVLFYKFAFQTFVYYEDVRRQADILDEPEGCKDFYAFRALLYERYNWDQMMKHYFKTYVLPHIRGAGVNIALAKMIKRFSIFFIQIELKDFLANSNGFTGPSRNRARQPSGGKLKTLITVHQMMQRPLAEIPVTAAVDGSGPRALISVTQKNAIMRAFLKVIIKSSECIPSFFSL